MTPADPERSRLRRIGAIASLLAVAAVLASWLGSSWPREQLLVVRLPERPEAGLGRLELTFTRVGDLEPERGLSLAVPPGRSRTVRHTASLPDGDYLVTLELAWEPPSGPDPPNKSKTTLARRVTLDGGETLLTFDGQSPE